MINPKQRLIAVCGLIFLFATFPSQAGLEEGMEANRKGDRQTAFNEFYAASFAGDERAFGKLGGMYLYGLGTEKDYVKAYAWFGLSAQMGDRYGQRFQDAASSAMTPKQVGDAERLLQEYREQLNLSETSHEQ
ncbi:hypothetical protein DJ030_11660 [bacterium endosymbiont of Escarpia laminata]|nr:MAG: hypothetical protein DJ030_11660 [bacterium endosymbiont of Escarpia laminata]